MNTASDPDSAGRHDDFESLAGRLLAEARHRAGISQAELARRAGTSRSVVNAIEHSKRQPSVATLGRLLEGAGSGIKHDLVEGKSEPGPLLASLLMSRSGPERELTDEELKRARMVFGVIDVAHRIKTAKSSGIARAVS